jgi:hypothetical protein
LQDKRRDRNPNQDICHKLYLSSKDGAGWARPRFWESTGEIREDTPRSPLSAPKIFVTTLYLGAPPPNGPVSGTTAPTSMTGPLLSSVGALAAGGVASPTQPAANNAVTGVINIKNHVFCFAAPR